MKKFSVLDDEIFTMKKPDISWFKPLMAVVIIVAVCWGIYVVTSLMSV
jgi:hypothetical protein